MNVNWKKIMAIGLAVFSVGMMGCASKEQTNDDYLICNKTSNGQMAENEEGYFFVSNQFLYYADKDNLENWVAVCNKPDCSHESTSCNSYLLTANTVWQKDGKLYETTINNTDKYLSVYEISLDGSGMKNVYEIPTEAFPSGHGKATFQDEFVIRYNYLDEKGLLQERIICLEEDKNGKVSIKTLYEDTVNNASLVLSGNECWDIRGENLLATTLYLKEGGVAMENLCKIEESQIKPLNLPDDVELYGSYFKDDVFTYYKQKEGFYEYHVKTGEKNLVFENQLEDGQGFILSEDCIIECNRYLYYTPEKVHLRFYNGDEWFEVELPEQLAKSDDPFYPVSIASDRIFFRRNVMQGENDDITAVQIYYMMLNDENLQLTLAGTIGEDITEEETSTETKEEDIFSKFEEVTVWDTEDYLFKVTDVYLDYSNRCCVKFYLENRSDDKKYSVYGGYVTINGIQCYTAWGTDKVDANKNLIEELKFIDDMVDTSRVSDFYDASEYTDIEFCFTLKEIENDSTKEQTKIVHIYPQGEENATRFAREVKDTDEVLIDNENLSVTVVGYDENFVPNDTIYVVIENKTDSFVRVKVEEASANGISVTPTKYFGVYWTIANPKSTVLYPMTLFDENPNGGSAEGPARFYPLDTFFVENNITSIEEIEMKLRITEYHLVSFGEDFLYETFVLNP